MPAAINSARIDHREYEAIIARVRALGRSDSALAQIAAEFNRGVNTIRRLAPRAG